MIVIGTSIVINWRALKVDGVYSRTPLQWVVA